jgi:hypothetical protein
MCAVMKRNEENRSSHGHINPIIPSPFPKSHPPTVMVFFLVQHSLGFIMFSKETRYLLAKAVCHVSKFSETYQWLCTLLPDKVLVFYGFDAWLFLQCPFTLSITCSISSTVTILDHMILYLDYLRDHVLLGQT